GADGGAHPNFKRPYFYYDEIDAEGPEQDFLQRPDMLPFRNRPDLLEEANRRLQSGDRNVARAAKLVLAKLDTGRCQRRHVPSGSRCSMTRTRSGATFLRQPRLQARTIDSTGQNR